LTTIRFLGERQGIIDPEAAVLVAGETRNAEVCPPAARRRPVGSRPAAGNDGEMEKDTAGEQPAAAYLHQRGCKHLAGLRRFT
jgi:hypothetical protein